MARSTKTSAPTFLSNATRLVSLPSVLIASRTLDTTSGSPQRPEFAAGVQFLGDKARIATKLANRIKDLGYESGSPQRPEFAAGVQFLGDKARIATKLAN